jgi:hypothetical protein
VSKAKGRFELRGYLPNTRGKLTRIRTFTQHFNDPQVAALEIFRIKNEGQAIGGRQSQWVMEVVDLSKKKGKLAPVVTYEELKRGMYVAPPDEPVLPPGTKRG